MIMHHSRKNLIMQHRLTVSKKTLLLLDLHSLPVIQKVKWPLSIFFPFSQDLFREDFSHSHWHMAEKELPTFLIPPSSQPRWRCIYSISLSLYPPSGERVQGLQPLLLSNSATALHHQVQIAPIIFSLTNLGAGIIIGSSMDNKTIIHRPVS